MTATLVSDRPKMHSVRRVAAIDRTALAQTPLRSGASPPVEGQLAARARRLRELPIEYVSSPEFEAPDAERTILSESLEVSAGAPSESNPVPDGATPYVVGLHDSRLLSKEEEQRLFRRMNFLKRLAARLQEGLAGRTSHVARMDKIEAMLAEAAAIRNRILAANVRLAASVAKRYVDAANTFGELLSDGHMSLLRAVERFDYSRGYRFSTYATWAMRYNFNRAAAVRRRRRQRFVSTDESLIDATTAAGESPGCTPREHRDLQQSLRRILTQLAPREQAIIAARFALTGDEPPQTLKQVAERIGVCKERVRQLEIRALEKLRKLADDARIELPGGE